jgi:hypothetical protein
MCISAAILAAGTLIGAAGSFVAAGQQSNAAYAEAAYREQQLQVQNNQIMEDIKLVELQAIQQENERQDQARRLRASNEAFIAGSGVGENMSYLQGTEKTNDLALRQDMTNLRLQASVGRGRMVDQIGVNRLEKQFVNDRASMISTQAYTNAFFNTASSITNNAYSYAKYKSK